jgi:hypothetical protein
MNNVIFCISRQLFSNGEETLYIVNDKEISIINYGTLVLWLCAANTGWDNIKLVIMDRLCLDYE